MFVIFNKQLWRRCLSGISIRKRMINSWSNETRVRQFWSGLGSASNTLCVFSLLWLEFLHVKKKRESSLLFDSLPALVPSTLIPFYWPPNSETLILLPTSITGAEKKQGP